MEQPGPTEQPADELLSIAEVAALLGLNHITIQRMVQRGAIPAERHDDSRWVIRRADVDEYLEAVRIAPGSMTRGMYVRRR